MFGIDVLLYDVIRYPTISQQLVPKTMLTPTIISTYIPFNKVYSVNTFTIVVWSILGKQSKYFRAIFAMCAVFFFFCSLFDTLDLYKITVPKATRGDGYVGCYADDKEDRLLENEIKWQNNMTEDVCRDHCAEFSSHFYATQVKNKFKVRSITGTHALCVKGGARFACLALL